MDHTEEHLVLERIADVIDTATTERGWGQPPLLVHIRGSLDPRDDLDLGLRELDGHPAETLLGFSAPLSWTALGVSAEGWATACADTPHGYRAEAAPDAERERVRTLVLLGHRGEPVGRLRWENGHTITEAPDEGLVLDCLRRSLGRSTPPPTATTGVLFATMWLEHLVARSGPGARPLTWRQVCALHPAVQLLDQAPTDLQDGRSHADHDVVASARALAKVCNWTMVRQQAMQGWKAGLDPRLAVWMDTGMVSRWLLDGRAGLDDLLGHLASDCSPSVLRRVRQSLLALGIDVASAGAHAKEPDVA